MKEFSNFNDKEISILIVEDETVLALGLEYTLLEFGYEVLGIETTAKGAISSAFENEPDIILMDINLKGVTSGIEAAKQIWQYKQIPIIFLTSYSDEKTIKSAMTCEPYGYLLKPCRDKELTIAIQTAIHKHNYFFENKDSLCQNHSKKIILLEANLYFDKSKGILYKKEKPIKLTGNEVKLFEILTDYAGETVSFDKISSYIWRESLYDMGKLRNLVYRLRNKIGHDIFENVYENGYRLKVA